jgi:hypothetical protein
MRSTLLKLTLGLGLVTAALAPAAACQYHATTATNDQASSPQTAQAQPTAQDESN